MMAHCRFSTQDTLLRRIQLYQYLLDDIQLCTVTYKIIAGSSSPANFLRRTCIKCYICYELKPLGETITF